MHMNTHMNTHTNTHMNTHMNTPRIRTQTYDKQERTWTGTWMCSMDMEMYKTIDAGMPIKSLVQHR
jgi:hypothetical protein